MTMIVNEARQLGEPSRRDHPVLDQAMVSVGKQLRPSARARGLRHGLQVSVRLRTRPGWHGSPRWASFLDDLIGGNAWC
jgi:hypothetical protein